MTTPYPGPESQPSTPAKAGSTGTAPLVIGIILLVLALIPAIRTLGALVAAFIVLDGYSFGVAIGSAIFTAVLVVPGILLIRRSNRARRARLQGPPQAV